MVLVRHGVGTAVFVASLAGQVGGAVVLRVLFAASEVLHVR